MTGQVIGVGYVTAHLDCLALRAVSVWGMATIAPPRKSATVPGPRALSSSRPGRFLFGPIDRTMLGPCGTCRRRQRQRSLRP